MSQRNMCIIFKNITLVLFFTSMSRTECLISMQDAKFELKGQMAQIRGPGSTLQSSLSDLIRARPCESMKKSN